MPTIKLNDQFGADVDVNLAPGSALLKYFQAVPALVLDHADLSKIGGLTLDQPALTSLSTGLSFQQEAGGGENAPGLLIQAGAHGSFALISRQPGSDSLFASDPYGEDIKIPEGTCYVSTGVQASVGVSAAASSGELSFGAGAGTTIEIANYRNFPLESGTTLLDALRQAIGGFLLPLHADDLAALPARGVATATVTGSLTFSATADLLAITNPLAAATLPGLSSTVSVKAGGTVQVGASYKIACQYQVRVHKLENGRIRLGWYREQSKEFQVQATAGAVVSGGFGDTDLFSTILGGISANPAADRNELAQAGISEGQRVAIESAVQAAVARKLEIALSAEITSLAAGQAAFLYEIDLPATTPESRQAIERALLGDLSGLQTGALPGVSCLDTIWARVQKSSVTLHVNLLGIYNFVSIASLVRSGSVLYEPVTGALVLTDKSCAERVRSGQVNFGADTQKLRHVLAESFLITAAYRGMQQAVGGPSLHASHSFFDLQNNTSRDDMERSLRVGVALGLLAAGDAKPPDGVEDFGRTMIHAQTDYNDALTVGLFLDRDGSALPREFYENTGRAGIQLLVSGTGPDAARRKPAIDDDLWRKMKDQGQPNFAALLPGVSAPLLGAIVADYSTIVWWADAMCGAAKRLAAIRKFFRDNPTASPQDPAFQALRQDLADHLAKVAAKTTEEFGQPWGLVVMNEVAGRRAGASILITGPKFGLSKERAL